MNVKKLMAAEPNFVPAKKPKSRTVKTVVYYAVGVLLSLIFLFPLLYMFAASTKTEEQLAFSAGSFLMFLPQFDDMPHFFANYAVIFGSDYQVWKYALNSSFYALISIVFNVLVNGLAGYALSKLRFPGKKFFSAIIFFLMVVPVETSIIPQYSIVKYILHLSGVLSILAVILPASISVFNIFLFTEFFSSIPTELEEAMRLDGAGRFRIFFKLILPMSRPIVATVSVFTFIGVWNDYLWPTMVLPTPTSESGWPLYPIQAILTSIQANPATTTGEMMAVLVVTSLPIFILYAVAQKYIVKGFGTAGLKL